MTNAEISDVFSLLAKLMDIHGENSFKTKSYTNAAFTIDKLPSQLKDLPETQIASLKGIGDSTAKKIISLLQTGEMEQLKDLIEKTPPGILELLKIKGIGPKKIATVWHELNIESPGELLYACNENRLVNYKGFGEKSQQSIREALEFYFSNQRRYLYAQVEPLVYEIREILNVLFGATMVALTGDFKRQCEIIEEIDYVVISDLRSGIEKIKDPRFELKNENGENAHFLFHQLIPLNIYFTTRNNFGNVQFLHNASEEFIEKFNEAYPDANPGTEEYKTEEEIFSACSLPWLPPCVRETGKELKDPKAAVALISTAEILGVIHNHSTWSDGKNTIEEMALACIEKGYEYLVMSDHSVSSFYANGLTVDRIKKQQEEIDKLNEKLHPFKIFKSIECDILNDGRLDYDDGVLATFDLVIASVHQNLKMTGEKAMQRLLEAVANPFTTILGHPTGRLLLSRKEYPVDHHELINACKQHNVVIEINANPRRLDMDWRFIPDAMAAGVMMSIDPDAHSIKGIDDIRYGVLSAQKGMLTANHNLSSLNLKQFENFIGKKAIR